MAIDRRKSKQWKTGLGVLLVLTAVGTASSGVVGARQERTLPDDEVMEPERLLADLRYREGLRVTFTIDDQTREYGMLQEGQMDRTGPLPHRDGESLLAIYLAITPRSLPVPEALLADAPPDVVAQARATRTITSSPQVATGVALPLTAPTPVSFAQTCFSTYYDWWDWFDGADVGMVPKTYYASSFGDKKRYADSYVFNCTPGGSPGWLTARHRVYYKNVFGNYKKHHDADIAPGHWQATHKGSSVRRWRRVTYSDNWNASPSCGGLVDIDCKYTRHGRFHD